jgi:hypothetical protein
MTGRSPTVDGKWDPTAKLASPWLSASPLFPLLPIVIYAAAGSFEGGATFWSVAALGVLVAWASLIAGGALGFLFGLPRTLERAGSTATLVTNTNLDQISDWLTKILIGLGLVQLGKVAEGIDGLATAIAPGLGGTSAAQPFAVALLVYSAVDGFLVGYLWTRIVLSRQLKEAAEVLASTKDAEHILESPPPDAPPASLPPAPET